MLESTAIRDTVAIVSLSASGLLAGMMLGIFIAGYEFFMENFAQAVPKVGGELVLRMALAPETRLQMIAVHDIGVFAALAFEGREGIAGRTLEIAGDELSMTELAQKFAAAAGRPVQFRRQPFAADRDTVARQQLVHANQAQRRITIKPRLDLRQ
jgi:uncharacterized protein YbjT (DUF2867 family)